MTSYSNTWALGRLGPGAAATFRWVVTPVQPGSYRVRYEIAGGLAGDRVQLSDGAEPTGTFTVTIPPAPAREYLKASGQIVRQP